MGTTETVFPFYTQYQAVTRKFTLAAQTNYQVAHGPEHNGSCG